MMHLRLSHEAREDLRGIWIYSAQTWGPQQANRYLDAIRAAITGLADGTTVSRSAADVLPGCRRVTSGRHVVYFREDADAVEVIRVLHQRMDAERWV